MSQEDLGKGLGRPASTGGTRSELCSLSPALSVYITGVFLSSFVFKGSTKINFFYYYIAPITHPFSIMRFFVLLRVWFVRAVRRCWTSCRLCFSRGQCCLWEPRHFICWNALSKSLGHWMQLILTRNRPRESEDAEKGFFWRGSPV